ncbi:hypothetical protein KSP40_PGU010989 [Platanthera guangdongensis]|uniref:Uncharacterized protein n=1 Tax=Platanthera guangdongensis TaxID=2320717 RepID=A0ABR2LJZ8_9ASPA
MWIMIGLLMENGWLQMIQLLILFSGPWTDEVIDVHIHVQGDYNRFQEVNITTKLGRAHFCCKFPAAEKPFTYLFSYHILILHYIIMRVLKYFRNPGHPFCSGITSSKLAAIITNGLVNETFDASGALDKVMDVTWAVTRLQWRMRCGSFTCRLDGKLKLHIGGC